MNSPSNEQPLQGFIAECEREALHRTRFIQPYGVLLAGEAGDARIRHLSANAADWLDGLDKSPDALLGQALPVAIPAFIQAIGEGPDAEHWMYPGADKQLLSGVCSGPQGLLNGWLSRSEHHWLLELERALPENQRLNAYRPIPHRLFRMPGSESEWTHYCQFLADTVREVTGFERVMIYRFRDDESGEVITESLIDDVEPYLGLRFPASDIPQIARELYLANSHRQIPDRTAEPVPIFSQDERLLLDLTLSDLRAVSPVHLEYLKNMGVTASLSYSIVVGERLWGLMACHHRQPRELPLPIRERCVAMCQAFSMAISGYYSTQRLLELSESEQEITQLHAALREADAAPAYGDFTQPTALGDRLLRLVNASGAALVDGEALICFGQTPPEEAIRAQVHWLITEGRERVFVTDHLPELFPPAAHHKASCSGLLAVLLSRFDVSGERVFLWWRPEQPQSVTWAGDPRKSALSDQGHSMLSPRSSFEHWVETSSGHSEPWSNRDLLRASKFRSLLLRDINADLLSL
ncbi:GAF domain-containing protein [Rhabdochromatium marinum]|uniref:GAF domain-containing protein n=1 Tax=Rhabdochromatium marinum TaxID=48729 RepID=UPI001905BAF5|nr:GAF domain-containing protein [Rhabdochromatium marinum]MBK1648288.1 histidine kinase [Rhabdochromatium marinum]